MKVTYKKTLPDPYHDEAEEAEKETITAMKSCLVGMLIILAAIALSMFGIASLIF